MRDGRELTSGAAAPRCVGKGRTGRDAYGRVVGWLGVQPETWTMVLPATRSATVRGWSLSTSKMMSTMTPSPK